MAHTDVSLRVNRRSAALPRDASSTFEVWVGEFSGSLSAGRQMSVDVPPPQFLLASQKMSYRHHTSPAEGKSAILGVLNKTNFQGHIDSHVRCILGATGRFKKVRPVKPQSFLRAERTSST